jgi:CubicO group peptidase (beta-lactamase class C family)
MDVDTTVFDLASVTKIVATTAATAILVDQGYLQLNETVASDRLLGPAFAANGKGSISVLNLLVHNAGFPADPNPNYYAPDFGCPPSGQNPPTPVTTCRDKIYGSLMQQPLDTEPNTQYVYSDLSFISLMFVVGRVVSAEGLISPTDLRADCPTATAPQTYICNFEAFVRVRVFEYLSMKQTTFQPPSVDWPRCAPAENGTIEIQD